MKLPLKLQNQNLKFWYSITGFGMVLSLALIFLPFLSFQKKPLEQYPIGTGPSISSGRPLFLSVANITDQQATILFTTEKSGQASLYLQDPQTRYTDDQGEATQDFSHQVSLSGLKENTEYLVRFCTNLSCDQDSPDWYGLTKEAAGQTNPALLTEKNLTANGDYLRIRTGQSGDITTRPVNMVFGTTGNMPASGYILLQTANKQASASSALLGSTVNQNGGWAFDLANLRLADDQGFLDPSSKGTVLNLRLLSGSKETKTSFSYLDSQGKPIAISF
jgi:hypothetical protein